MARWYPKALSWRRRDRQERPSVRRFAADLRHWWVCGYRFGSLGDYGWRCNACKRELPGPPSSGRTGTRTAKRK
jgi:hypothetical protein